MDLGIKVVIEKELSFTCVKLIGRLDGASTPIAEKELELVVSQGKSFIVDCAELHYLSSAGIRLFLSLTKKMGAKKALVFYVQIKEDVWDIIKMAGFDALFSVADTRVEACRKLSQTQ